MWRFGRGGDSGGICPIGDIGSITRFIQQDQFSGVPLDARLPLKDAKLPTEDAELSLKDANILQYFSDPGKATQFIRKQWTFLAPVFSENRLHRELDERTVLPFLRRDSIGKGGFAKVYKVKVHASHHTLSSTSTEVSLPG